MDGTGKAGVPEVAVFLAARLDEAEAAANAGARRVGCSWDADPQPGTPGGLVTDERGLVASTGGLYAAIHIALNDPAAVLADIAADRKLLAALAGVREMLPGPYKGGYCDALETAVAIRAERFSGHPEWKAEWAA